MKILPAGDSAAVAQFENVISPEVNAKVHSLDFAIRSMGINGVTETVPTFTSLLVCYDPTVISFAELYQKLGALSSEVSGENKSSFIYTLPVCYGGEFGEDLADVAEYAKISPEEVIARHTAKPYLIYMLGFLPGFAYLGGLDETIACPRLSSPRQKIEAGSVGIGGNQTGIYPIASPGGWRLIGRTPIRPYDPERSDPILYSAGDCIRFKAITRAEYDEIAAAVASGEYVPEKEAVS